MPEHDEVIAAVDNRIGGRVELHGSAAMLNAYDHDVQPGTLDHG
jgi:hypothetical protein